MIIGIEESMTVVFVWVVFVLILCVYCVLSSVYLESCVENKTTEENINLPRTTKKMTLYRHIIEDGKTPLMAPVS